MYFNIDITLHISLVDRFRPSVIETRETADVRPYIVDGAKTHRTST